MFRSRPNSSSSHQPSRVPFRRLVTPLYGLTRRPMMSQQDQENILWKIIKPLLNPIVLTIFGIIPIFIYSLFILKSYPIGLEISSILFLIFSSFTFYFIYLIILVIIDSIGYFIHQFSNKFSEKDSRPFIIYSIGSLILPIVLFSILLPLKELIFFINIIKIGFLTAAILIGTVIWDIINSTNKTLQDKATTINFLTLFTIYFTMFSIPPTWIIEPALRFINIKEDNVSVILNDADWDYIKQISNQTEDYFFMDCDGEKIVHDVNILWQSIGTESIIRLYSANSGEEYDIIIKSENLKKMPTSNIKKQQCIIQTFTDIFKSGDDKLNKKKEEMKKKYSTITDEWNKISKDKKFLFISITGFSDRSSNKSTTKNQSKPNKKDNYHLGLARATEVKNFLFPNYSSSHVIINSEGSKYAAEKCEGIKEKEDLAHCQADDRKVEIKFHFDKQPKKTKETSTAS